VLHLKTSRWPSLTSESCGARTGQGLPAPLAVEPWQPASKFRRDRSASGNSVRFKFKPEGVGTVIVSTTSGIVPTASTLSFPPDLDHRRRDISSARD
jgi:hypothetical protein